MYTKAEFNCDWRVMFTGIIERVGVVRAVRGSAGGKVVSVELGELLVHRLVF